MGRDERIDKSEKMMGKENEEGIGTGKKNEKKRRG